MSVCRTPMREVTEDDMLAAARGLCMMSMSCDDLLALAHHHERGDEPISFASKVIAMAARETLKWKRSVEGGQRRAAAALHNKEMGNP